MGSSYGWIRGKALKHYLTQDERERLPWMRERSGFYLLCLLFVGLLVRLVPAYLVYGSYDVGAWRQVLMHQSIGQNPYLTHKLNWPPLWPTLLLWAGRMQSVYGVPDYFVVKIPSILCDVAIGIALYIYFHQTEPTQPENACRWASLYVLNPVAIFTCAVHGQFDCIPALFVLLTVLSFMQTAENTFPLGSAVWLSLGVLSRTWPVVLLPLFIGRISHWSKRFAFLTIVLLPSLLSIWLLYLQVPATINQDVLHYRGDIGDWGLASAANLFPQIPSWRSLTGWVVRKLLYLGWFALYVVFWRRKPDIRKLVCLAIISYYVFTPHAGLQHFEWVVPLAVLAQPRWVTGYTVVATITLACYYYWWPFNGEHFDFLSRYHSASYYSHYLTVHTHLLTTLLMFPLWLYCVTWYIALWRDCFFANNLQSGSLPILEDSGVVAH